MRSPGWGVALLALAGFAFITAPLSEEQIADFIRIPKPLK
jgi:hypothetical protein